MTPAPTVEHGTRRGYLAELRAGVPTCSACRDANASYHRDRRRALRRPDEVWGPYVSLGAVHEGLEDLRAAGVGLDVISAATGVSRSGLQLLARRRGRKRSHRARPTTADAVLSVTPASLTAAGRLGGRMLVSAAGSRRMLDDLAAAGWSRAALARMLGRSDRHLVRGARVTVATASAVAGLYRRLRETDSGSRVDEERMGA